MHSLATFDHLPIHEVTAYDHEAGIVFVRLCARGPVYQLPMREIVVSLTA
jgi:hypothetical protein